jgi:hypothetical protein
MLLETTPDIKANKISEGNLVDHAYLYRELERLFDEMRKEVKARRELASSKAAYSRVKKCVQDPSTDLTIRGEIATGTPEVKTQAALPKKFSEGYYQFCEAMGVPLSIAEAGVLKLDWKQVTELCTQRHAEGKPIPPGLGKEYPLYFCILRKAVDHGKKN